MYNVKCSMNNAKCAMHNVNCTMQMEKFKKAQYAMHTAKYTKWEI